MLSTDFGIIKLHLDVVIMDIMTKSQDEAFETS